MFTLICVWINGCVNNREAGDLRRYCVHYGVTVMYEPIAGLDKAVQKKPSWRLASPRKFAWKHYQTHCSDWHIINHFLSCTINRKVHFNNVYEIVNLGDLKLSLLNKLPIFQCTVWVRWNIISILKMWFLYIKTLHPCETQMGIVYCNYIWRIHLSCNCERECCIPLCVRIVYLGLLKYLSARLSSMTHCCKDLR